jgi:tetratricopeptide (TPR) repeat protein
VIDRLDIVAVGIEDEGGVIARMVGPFARGAIVGAAGGEGGLVEGVDRGAVFGLERQVDMGLRSGAIGGRDEKFVAIEELIAGRSHNDPVALFEFASAHDSTDHEVEAAALYRQALALGLAGTLRRRATIQLASTLRNLGQAEAAVALLRAEQSQPSDELDDAVTAFLALCLSNLGRDREALSLALTALSPHLPRYSRSLTNYAKALLNQQ